MKMTPRGDLQVSADVKEKLVEELTGQIEGEDLPVRTGVSATHLERRSDGGYDVQLKDGEPIAARHVIVALGRSGNFRKLDVPGEDLPKVYNRLHDPAKYKDQKVLVVGGGDSAAEAAIALRQEGAEVTLSYRSKELSRPKPENVAALEDADIELLMPSTVTEITEAEVTLDVDGESRTLENDAVFPMIGREPPLDFFRKSGIPILGEMTRAKWKAFIGFLVFCTVMYVWKSGYVPTGLGWIGAGDKTTLVGSFVNATKDPSFYYTFAYSACVVVFGLRRIRKRKTPYVKRQTYTLMGVQVIPLFILPQIFLPWIGENGWMPGWIEQHFFPEGNYWRAYGLVLAWPLFFWNLASAQPIWGWLVLSVIQTFVIIPLIIRRWGKGAYCGWICSCGALAETMGDDHRHKMWHGPEANKWNFAGQVILAFALFGLFWRILGWSLADGNFFARSFNVLFAYPWKFGVDLVIAGIIGVGFYFWFSGRVWCRFACPLAALMHIYTKFSRYRIFGEKDKCISCNVCTTVCHQGIDIMSFANKGKPMTDVECVRCSACVQECPTGTLSFGTVDAAGRPDAVDSVYASPIHQNEAPDLKALLVRLQKQHDQNVHP